MKDIIIGFSTKKKFSLFSAAIKLVEGTDYSHTYADFYTNKMQRSLIYHASEMRVNFMNRSIFDRTNKTVKQYKITVTDEQYVEIMRAMLDSLGEKYGWFQIIGMIPVLTARLFNKRIKNPLSSGTICSEAIFNILKSLPDNYIQIYMNENGLTKEELTPLDVDKALSRFCVPL